MAVSVTFWIYIRILSILLKQQNLLIFVSYNIKVASRLQLAGLQENLQILGREITSAFFPNFTQSLNLDKSAIACIFY